MPVHSPTPPSHRAETPWPRARCAVCGVLCPSAQTWPPLACRNNNNNNPEVMQPTSFYSILVLHLLFPTNLHFNIFCSYSLRPNWLSLDGCMLFIWVYFARVCGVCHSSAGSREFGDCSCVSAPLETQMLSFWFCRTPTCAGPHLCRQGLPVSKTNC
jgi:hypothetical protein